MGKTEPREYKVLISDEGGGVVRGRIPAPLARDMGARAGDYLVFRSDGAGNVTVSLARTRGSGTKQAGGAKSAKSKAAAKGKKRR